MRCEAIFSNTLARPALILDDANRPGLARRGHERYVRHDADLGCHVIVPARILGPKDEETIAGYGTVSSGTRIALTVYTSDDIPFGAVVWRST